MTTKDDYQLKLYIIEEMQNYPIIYNKANPHHYQRDKRQKIFDDIGAILVIEGECFSMIHTGKTVAMFSVIRNQIQFSIDK